MIAALKGMGRIDQRVPIDRIVHRALVMAMSCAVTFGGARAGSPFAAAVVDYAPAPGQFVNHALFNDPSRALGSPIGYGTIDGNQLDVVTLGGFGGSITLRFDHTVLDDSANPFGLDAIVFGNAFWVGGNPNRRWAECAHLEISLDVNRNGIADDPWYLIPGSHLLNPPAMLQSQTWDHDISDSTFPPSNGSWIPPNMPDPWTTTAWRLPPAVFDPVVVINPNGTSANVEGVWGYAEASPTLMLGDLDGDNLVDDLTISPELFYTVPDDPLEVGVTPGSGGGDAFDIAWAIDPNTGKPAALPGFDFIRITNGVNFVHPALGEKSPEIDAVADVRPDPFGDADGDGYVDAEDFANFSLCLSEPGRVPESFFCLLFDVDLDSDVDLFDFAYLQQTYTGA